MRKLLNKDKGDSHNFWMSYTDLMTGFLVVFIVISAIMYHQYSSSKESYNQLFKTFQNKSPEEIGQQISEMSHELDSLKGANLKNLIYEYKNIFVSNSYVKVKFDSERGSIVLTSNNPRKYLFASGSPDFEPELRQYLDKISRPLVKRTMELWTDYKCKNVELRIEGHTDPDGISKGCLRGSDLSFNENLKLSSNRANKVYEYILNKENLSDSEKEFVKKNMISVGYSFSRRVYDNNINDTKLDPASRRIEFRIISK